MEASECISIDPMKGIIPANNYIDIEVCFVPKSSKEEKSIKEDREDKGLKEEDEEFIAKYEVVIDFLGNLNYNNLH